MLCKLKHMVCLTFLLFFISACSGIGAMTPQAAVAVSDSVITAQGFLHALNEFYNDLVELKALPDHTTEATRALAIADAAAALIKSFCAGEYVGNPNARLNEIAGMVDGAKAILNTMK